MAQQLEQTNPGLVSSLRQTMQNVTGGNTNQNSNADQETKENGKIMELHNCFFFKCQLSLKLQFLKY